MNVKKRKLLSNLAFSFNLRRYALAAFAEYDEARYGTRPNFFAFKCAKGSQTR
jgi:hypothetical protein